MMPEVKADFGPPLSGLGRSDWIAEVEELASYDGYLSHLGKKHLAVFSEHGPSLLVSFETLQGIQALSPTAHPLGWEMVKSQGWSSLTLISDGDTWFRNAAVYAYFDRLVDDGFFDEFERVVFYGAGSCGYAAAAYSVVAPGARVLTIQPQATLAPDLTEWDTRFQEQRRVNFSDRYGFAPDMLEAAAQAYIVYDPTQIEDAMHAALFTRPNVTKLRMRHMGAAVQTDLLQMGILYDLLELAHDGRLSQRQFASIARARRTHLPYLRRLLTKLDQDGRTELVRLLCRNVNARMRAPRFARRLESLPDPDV
jgi:hypothetical protein